MRYSVHLWNKEYGNKAKFIVKDKKTGNFTEFSPDRPKDYVWVSRDLRKEDVYSKWEDFKGEPVEKIEDIAM